VQGVRDVIMRSDETWVLAILESDDRCGNDCRNMRKEYAQLGECALRRAGCVGEGDERPTMPLLTP
jgi:hypothetical protein